MRDTAAAPAAPPSADWKKLTIVPRRLLQASALFLGGAGIVQVALELLGHFARVGPHADTFGGSSYTIGFVEAHALAVLLAMVFWRGARRPARQLHLMAGSTHLLLAGANLLFWSSFATFGLEVPGAVATVLHLGLGTAHVFAVRPVGAENAATPVASTDDLGFRAVATAVLAIGVYLHVTHVLVGREVFLESVLRPEIEWTVTAGMIYTLAVGLLLRGRLAGSGRWLAIAYHVILAYFAVSVLVHMRAVITADTEYVRAFPDWYSYPVIVVMLAFLLVIRKLRFARGERRVIAPELGR